MNIAYLMTNTSEEIAPQYPNNLRLIRQTQAMISRSQLVQKCMNLFNEDKTKYVKVGMTTLHDLEAGIRRPRLNTAATIARALSVPADELFPAGYDDPNRNPQGRVDNGTNWPRPGRPKKQEP